MGVVEIMEGTLYITIDEGRNLKNTDTFGEMSPICTVEIGDQVQSSTKSKKGGSNPRWNFTCKAFKVKTSAQFPDAMKIRVHDKDSRLGSTSVSSLVGRVHVGGGQRSLIDFRDCEEPIKRWAPLVRYSGKARGFVGLTVQFVPNE